VRDHTVAVGGGAVGVALAAAGFRERDAHTGAVGAVGGHLALGVVTLAADVGTLRVGRAAVGQAVVVGRTRERVAEVLGAWIVVVEVDRRIGAEAGARAQRCLTLVVAERAVGVGDARVHGHFRTVGELGRWLLCGNERGEQKSVQHRCRWHTFTSRMPHTRTNEYGNRTNFHSNRMPPLS
jgi:hypothetical protein